MILNKEQIEQMKEHKAKFICIDDLIDTILDKDEQLKLLKYSINNRINLIIAKNKEIEEAKKHYENCFGNYAECNAEFAICRQENKQLKEVLTKYDIIQCEKCGERFIPNNTKQKYCNVCGKDIDKIKAKERMKRIRQK
jgi:ribosomal protein L37E